MDTDDSDSIVQVEFGRFIRLGAPKKTPGGSSRSLPVPMVKGESKAEQIGIAEEAARDTSSLRQDVEDAGEALAACEGREARHEPTGTADGGGS